MPGSMAEMKGQPVPPGKRGSTPKPTRGPQGTGGSKPKLLSAYNIFQKTAHEDMYRKFGGKECLASNLRANHQISTKVCIVYV